MLTFLLISPILDLQALQRQVLRKELNVVTTLEAIELFYSEMANEIYHSSASESLKDELIYSLKQVSETVKSTCETEKK